MDIKLKIDINAMPAALRIAVSAIPSVIMIVLAIIFLILPKLDEIRKLKADILAQENEIAKDQAKVAKLTMLMAENERLKNRMAELSIQLPEEKEVSGLLKQVSDLGIKSGLKIILWKPEQKRDHSSGIIYEIPVVVELTGSYHNLGIFFSSLTTLNRIINIADIKLGNPAYQRTEAVLNTAFKAVTFSAMSEREIAARAGKDKKEAAPKNAPEAKGE